ncbi:unnamed protein product, partial [Brenthis ino]
MLGHYYTAPSSSMGLLQPYYSLFVGRNQEKLQNVLKKCDASGSKNLVISADITKENDGKRIIEETIDKFGKLDVLINNAGIISFVCVAEENVMEVYDSTINTNLRAHVYLTHLAIPYLIKTKGNIIYISSVAATLPPVAPNLTIYGVSKAALNQFAKGVAAELAPQGVRANIVSPGPVKTDIMNNAGVDIELDETNFKTPLGRISDPEEIADLIVYLVSEKAKAITGSEYVCDNGFKLKF